MSVTHWEKYSTSSLGIFIKLPCTLLHAALNVGWCSFGEWEHLISIKGEMLKVCPLCVCVTVFCIHVHTYAFMDEYLHCLLVTYNYCSP